MPALVTIFSLQMDLNLLSYLAQEFHVTQVKCNVEQAHEAVGKFKLNNQTASHITA